MSRKLTSLLTAAGFGALSVIPASPVHASEAPAPIEGVFKALQTVGDFDGDGTLDRAWIPKAMKQKLVNGTLSCAIDVKWGNATTGKVPYVLTPTTQLDPKGTYNCPDWVRSVSLGGSTDHFAVGAYHDYAAPGLATWHLVAADGKVTKTTIPQGSDFSVQFRDVTGNGATEAVVFNVKNNTHMLFKATEGTFKRVVNPTTDCGKGDVESLRQAPRRAHMFVILDAKQCKTDKPGIYWLQPDLTYKHILSPKAGEVLHRVRVKDAHLKQDPLKLLVSAHDAKTNEPKPVRVYNWTADGKLTLDADHANNPANPDQGNEPTPQPDKPADPKPADPKPIDHNPYHGIQAWNDTVVMTHKVHETGDIPVLKNDLNAAGAVVTIVKQPKIGTAKVLADGRIAYDRRGKGMETDTLTYKATAPNGAFSTGLLTIKMKGAPAGATDPKPGNANPYHGIVALNDKVIMTHRVHEVGDIPVLKNDQNADGAVVSIIQQPTIGTAKVLADGRIHYDRRGKGVQTDMLMYKVTAPNGATSTARLVISVKQS